MLFSVKKRHVAFIFTVLCSLGIFLSPSFAHKQSIKKLDFSNIFLQEGASNISTNSSFADFHLFVGSVDTKETISALFDFEIEEEDDFSGFKKYYKVYPASSQSFAIAGLNTTFKSTRKVPTSYSLPLFKKLPLFIVNQVFLI